MSYTANILPKEAAYYRIQNASIVNEHMLLNIGSVITLDIDKTRLTSIPKSILVNFESTPILDPLQDDVIFYLDIRMTDGTVQNVALYPNILDTHLNSFEVTLKDGDYDKCTLTVVSNVECDISLWEICPEASDTDTEVIIDGVKQSLPRLLFDYNTWPLEIGRDEQTVALITFILKGNTDLQGHFLMSYIADQSCTLTLRFKDAETTELFAPVIYDIAAGKGSVSVPHSYLERLAGIHSVIVTAQISRGKLTVDTRDILFTIDGGYLAERIMDIGADVRDISIRQLSENYGPDEIWIIGIEAGEAIVRKRKYSTDAAITFEPQFKLGKAKEAAIEFDGTWLLREMQNNHTIETEENPWVFWVDMEDILWAQIGEDETTKVQIDTDVTSMSVVRGYKSVFYPEQDQGLVCAYIKQGVAYYRTFAYVKEVGYTMWSEVYTIYDEQPVLSVHIQRLNDYRLECTISTATQNIWKITDRTYVTQAIAPENFYYNIRQLIILNNAPPNFTFSPLTVSTRVDTKKKELVAEFNYNVRCMDYMTYYDILNCFTVVDEQTRNDIQEIIIEDNTITFRLKDMIKGSVTITPNSFLMQYLVPNYGWQIMPSIPWIFQQWAATNDFVYNASYNTKLSIRGITKQYVTLNDDTDIFKYTYTQEQLKIALTSVQTKQVTLRESDNTFVYNYQIPTVKLNISHNTVDPV